jgi:hypothetical protein
MAQRSFPMLQGLICWLAFANVSQLEVNGATLDPVVSSVPLSKLREQFIGISSIDIQGTYTVQTRDVNGALSATPYQVATHYREESDKVWFETEKKGSGSLPFFDHWLMAYNGDLGQFYSSTDNLLVLKKKAAPLDHGGSIGLFNPLSHFIPFYPIQLRSSGDYLTKLKDFSDSTTWDKSITGIMPFAEGFPSHPNLTSFRCSSNENFLGVVMLDLRFGLDPAHGYLPLVWEGWAGHFLDEKYQVTDVGSTTSTGKPIFYYPKAFKLTFFAPFVLHPEIPIDIFTFKLTSLDINKHYTKSDFTVDPGIAPTIFDGDARQYIDVPR